MTTPSSSIYVRPGWTSTTWNYINASVGASAVTAVSFTLDSSLGQQVARGDFQYSLDGGRTWNAYWLQTDGEGSYAPPTATWRFVDRASGDSTSVGTFTMHLKLADGSVVTNNAAVVADDQPVGLIADGNTVLSTLHNGDAVAGLLPIDSGAPDGGRWVIEDQSQPGLFSVAVDQATGAAHLVVANAAAIPLVGQAATVTVHYYDRYQVDSSGNPVANTGVSDTLAFNVLRGTSQDLSGFGADLTLGTASGAQAAPAVASLSTGGFATVWQGSGSAIWAQVRDAAGNATGAAFAVTPAGDAATEGQPALSALSGGSFAVAYTIQQNGASTVAYRIVGANGSVGAQVVAGAAGDASMPTVTTLSDGSFVVGWSSGGQVHTLHSSASGAVIGGEHVFGALGTAYSPSIVGLKNGDYAVSWGEIGDGNVYMALGSNGSAKQVTFDGAAASISTAAPLPHVTALPGGGFVVAWDSYSNDQMGFSMSDIFFQRYDNAGNALGQIEQANIESGGGHYDAAVAPQADGGFVITWQGADGDANGVFGRRFGADGSAVDAHEFAINQLAQGDQSSADVAATANGGFVATWVDTQQGGSTIEARVLGGGGGGSADIGAGGGTTGSGTTSGSGTTGGSGSTSGTGSTGGSGSTSGSGSTGGTGTTGGSGTTGGTGTSGGTGSTGGSGATSPQQVTGTAGPNVFTPGAGSHSIDGGDGLDTVSYQGTHNAFQLTKSASGVSVDAIDGTVHDTLANVERVQFGDVSVAFDVNGTAGQAYRLYQAAFDRAPDQSGLGFWIKMMDGGQTLDQVSAGFVSSKEFADLVGANASDSQFVQALYHNVLHRTLDGGGYSFWMSALEDHGVSRAQVLSSFSESAENQAQVIGSIQDGMVFTPFG